MELKDRKLIKNGAFPKFEGGVSVFGMNEPVTPNFRTPTNPRTPERDALSRGTISKPNVTTDIIGAGAGAAGIIADAVTTATDNPSKNEILADTGQSTTSVGGVSYQQYNDIDKSLYKVNTGGNMLKGAAAGAAAGAAFGGIGAAIGAAGGALISGIGSLISRSKRKAAIRAAELDRRRRNMAAFDNAFTTGQLMKYAQRNGNTEDLVLFTAKNGKDAIPEYYVGKDIDTAFGRVKGKQNAWVNKGELIVDTTTGAAHEVTRGPNDTAPAYLRGRDAVITTKYGLADAAKDAYRNGDIEGVYDVLNAQKMMHMRGYKNGKDVPKYYDGIIPAWSNYVPNGIGALASIGQIIDASRLDIRTPDIYADNPYSAQALRDMAGMLFDAYPVAQALIRERAKTDRAIDASGGLSGALRYIGKIANAHNSYNTMANVWSDFQKGNISLRQAYNQAKIAAGEQSAQRRQNANQFNELYIANAHAAKRQGIQMGLRNALDYMNNWASMEIARRQANYMMGLYDEQVAYNTERNKSNNTPKTQSTVSTPKASVKSTPKSVSTKIGPDMFLHQNNPALKTGLANPSQYLNPWILTNPWLTQTVNKYGLR